MITKDWWKLNSKFYSSEVSTEDLEKILKEAVNKGHPNESVKVIEYEDDGVNLILNNDQEIFVEIDWDEFIIV